MADKHVWAVTAASIATVLGVVIAGVGLFSNNKASVSGSTVQSGLSLFGGVTQNITNPAAPKPVAGSAEDAKAKLRGDGLEFSPKAFADAAAEQTPEIVDLYLDAGMSPNSESANAGGMFVLALGLLDNPSNSVGLIDVFQRHHVDLSTTSPNYKSPYVRDGVTTMQDELFGIALGRADPNLIRRIVKAGGNPAKIIKVMADQCRQDRLNLDQANAVARQPYVYPYGSEADNARSARGYLVDQVARADAFRKAGLGVQGCHQEDVPPRLPT